METITDNTITKPELGTNNDALRAENASLKRQIGLLYHPQLTTYSYNHPIRY